ncbi:MAG: substrate-binding domain-containing protein, partial [Candidatus Sumerlaeota bacterium]
GEIKNWSEIGGPNRKIVRVGRDTSSGTYGSFSELVMNEEKMASDIETVGSNGAVQQSVKSTPEAIGYVGLGFLEGLKPLSIDDKKPTPQAVASGNYPIARPLFIFTNGFPKLGSQLHLFVTLYLTEKGQEMVEAQAYVPMTSY